MPRRRNGSTSSKASSGMNRDRSDMTTVFVNPNGKTRSMVFPMVFNGVINTCNLKGLRCYIRNPFLYAFFRTMKGVIVITPCVTPFA